MVMSMNPETIEATALTMYEQISHDRKLAQSRGDAPPFMTTAGYNMFMQKYVLGNETIRQRYTTIADCAGEYAAKMFGGTKEEWSARFFDYIWKGWLSPSTPVLINLGAPERGTPVSCTGNYVDDSIHGFYDSRLSNAVLGKAGFGLSSYMSDIRPRGSKISVGGAASGTLPVFKGMVQDARDVSQGNHRRGAWAGYLDITHGDFWEIAEYLYNNPDDLNIGWNIGDDFIASLDAGDAEAIARYQKVMKIRAVTGKGYLHFVDKANRQNPPMYIEHGLAVKGSNLCVETALHSDSEHSFTCVLSSLNLAFYDDWKDSEVIFYATVFLDCVAEAFLDIAKKTPGMEKVVRFTEKSRALGLGVLGFHTYLQQNMIPFESLQANTFNHLIFREIRDEAERASAWMAEIAGEPEWCRGYGKRNTHLMAIAPTLSTALICGSISQGIEPLLGNVWSQNTAAGNVLRVNPTLIPIMQQRGVYNQETISAIADNGGTVQDVDWLSDHEKLVFKTAFEINQEVIVRLADARAKYVDQGQSVNLFFAADEDEAYISQVHKQAMKSQHLKSLYYMRSRAGVKSSSGKSECIACEG